ncbi:hypothetical protein [Streptomyces sp. ODS28]|uniref:hypothetical protein n=1 Tax=Streptomyces sp. ODS28 TaxID=3136688 RepID=UPI0031EF984B
MIASAPGLSWVIQEQGWWAAMWALAGVGLVWAAVWAVRAGRTTMRRLTAYATGPQLTRLPGIFASALRG